jgi:LPXTG-motif cell wall-anchored protein
MSTIVTDSNGKLKEEYLPYLDPVTNVETGIVVTVGKENDWKYSWTNLPDTDCYGYKYYYYVEELPEGKDENKVSNAEKELNRLYGKDYQIRYFNNGAVDGDDILVRNHEKSFVKTMPSTGSTGKDFYLGMGLSILLCAGMLIILRKRSRGAGRRP